MRNAELESALDSCIAEIQSGRATQEDCLQRYTDYASALEPLLHEATRLAALADATIPDEAIDTLERRLLSRAAEIRATTSQNEPSLWSLFWSRLVGGRMRLVPAALSLGVCVGLRVSLWRRVGVGVAVGRRKGTGEGSGVISRTAMA